MLRHSHSERKLRRAPEREEGDLFEPLFRKENRVQLAVNAGPVHGYLQCEGNTTRSKGLTRLLVYLHASFLLLGTSSTGSTGIDSYDAGQSGSFSLLDTYKSSFGEHSS